MPDNLLPLHLPPDASATLLLVQGLDGTLYGPAARGDGLARGMAERFPGCAIYGFDYPCRLRQLAKMTEDALEPAAQRLAETLGRLDGGVALVGHCLGGLIATRAVLRIAPRPGRPITLFLLDSLADFPKAAPDAWARGLLEALKITEADLRAQGAAWRAMMASAPPGLNAHAILSGEESWITPFCPQNGIPAERTWRVARSHETLVALDASGNSPVLDRITADWPG